MPVPYLRATLENGDSYDDPSEDLLFMLLQDIEAGASTWVVVEKTSETSGQTYAQAIQLANGLFQVERRRGSEPTHETAAPQPLRAAHARLTEWAFGL